MKVMLAAILAISLCYTVSYAQSTPEAVFDAYKSALEKGDRTAYLALLTTQSRAIVNPSPGLMGREYGDIKDLKFYVQIRAYNKAEVQFSPPNKKAPPYILKKENGEWKIDLKAMGEAYVFDNNNEWHRK